MNLREGLLDMIEGGRLTRALIPDDFAWLLEKLDVTSCPDCDAVEGTPEWGTVGDGFDGYCPSCADKREAPCEAT